MARIRSALVSLARGPAPAEFLQLARQAAGLVLLVLAGDEVIRAEVGEHLAGGEHVPDHVEEAVGDRDGGFVRSPAAGYLPVLGAEIAVLGPCARASAPISSRRCRSSRCGKTTSNFAASISRVTSTTPIPHKRARFQEATG